MSMYMIQVHDGLKGVETILMEDLRDYEVGQRVSFSPKGPITVQDQYGNGVRLAPGMPFSGTVIEKRY